MAVDPGQVTEQQDVAGVAEGASGQETESGGFGLGAAIRGWLGRRSSPESSDAAEEPTPEQQPATPAPAPEPETVTMTRAELDRHVQSRSDQLLTKQQREWAKSRADEGDLVPIRTLAERGDPWAKQELSKNGDVWARGEIAVKDDLAEQARANDPIPHVAALYDQAILHPILAALPKEDEDRIMGAGVEGFDGRQKAVTAAIEALIKHARADGAKDAEKKLRSNPAVLKQVVLGDRATRDEPDDVPGVGDARGLTTDQRIRQAVLGR